MEKDLKKNKELTEKEKLFCIIYINNFNSTSAVIKAGYNCKNRLHASQIGYQLLNKTLVSQEVAKLKKEKMKSLKLDRNDIVERYMKIAFADMTDFVEFGREEVIDGIDEAGNSVAKMVNIIKFKSSDMVDGGLICQIKQGRDGVSIRLEDRQRALDWLSDYFEMNPMNEHRKTFDNKKLDIDREKLELEKIKANPTETEIEDDGFVEALKHESKSLWGDESGVEE